jgi:hypothetical protein
MPHCRLRLFALMLSSAPLVVGAQIVRDSGAVTSHEVVANGSMDVQSAVRAQSEFEAFRSEALIALNFGAATTAKCDERVGRSCYRYDERKRAPPTEPTAIRERREQLIAMLDTVAMHAPGNRWAAEQRVRYLVEAGRSDSALAAASECHADGWACEVLVGFSLHVLGRYPAADSAYGRALSKMLPTVRCEWRNLDLLIDDDTRQQYQRLPCGDPRRAAFEDRIWYFARTLYSLDGNDSRTEHYARKTMEMMYRDAPPLAIFHDAASAVAQIDDMETGISDEDLIEVMLRFGWPRAWVVNRSYPMGAGGRGRGARIGIWHWSANPAYRYVPPGFVLSSPATSDSSNWRLQLAPVIARYAPPYAVSLTPLEHQKAMFRRSDTALVVMAYDARVTNQLTGGKLTAALVVTPGAKPTDYGKIVHDAPETGTLIARAPWGPLLMSAEVYAPDKKAVARARYGITPPVAIGARVTLSDLLFYKPYGSFPSSVEAAAPHAFPTERLMANEKLGVYWESYGTDPAGEKMKISLTVLKEVEEAGFLKRKAESLKLVHEATPVVVSVEDLSAVGKSVTPRALELDISTLKKGSYIVQLEVEVAGQYTVRAEHRIEIIGP